MAFGEGVDVDGQEEALKEDEDENVGEIGDAQCEDVVDVVEVVTRLCHQVLNATSVG